MIGPFRKTIPNPWFHRGPMILAALWLAIGTPAVVLFDISWHGFLTKTLLVAYYILCYWLVALGAYRAIAFNPLLKRDYFRWLSTSTWTADRPLPDGPMRIVWQDVVVIGAICLMVGLVSNLYGPVRSYIIADDLWMPPWLILAVIFFGLYLGVNGFIFMLAIRPVAYAMIIPAMVGLCFGNVLALVLGLAVSLAVSQMGIRMLLTRLARTFRGEIDEPLAALVPDMRRSSSMKSILGGEMPAISWPHTMLAPLKDVPQIQVWEGTVLSVIVGLATYLACSLFQNATGMLVISLYAATFICFFRFIIYAKSCRSPISLCGRLFTFRWIIPRYDNFLLPIVAIAFLTGIMIALRVFLDASFLKLHEPLVCLAISMYLATVMWIAINAGPRLNRWRLTSTARMVPCGSAFLGTSNLEHKI